MISFPRFESNSKIRRLNLDWIDPNPAQPRRSFSRESIEELAESIRINGLLVPVSVRRVGDRYQLIAGERRLMAFRLLGESQIPAIVEQADDRRSASLAIIENMQRQQLNFYEEARAIASLIETNGLTQKQAAEQLGLSQPAVANKLRLLRLPEPAALLLIEAGATERHARALLPLEGKALLRAVHQVAEQRLTVAQTERLVTEALAGNIKHRRPIPVVRDVRLFFNTVNHAVETMRRSGIEARSEKNETDEYIEYTVRIPKKAACPKLVHTA